MEIEELLKDNKTNHYKLLTIVGTNQAKIKRIRLYLESKDWTIYDVEEVILNLVETMPDEKIKLRIGTEIKKWVKNIEEKIVFFNASILYSAEMDRIGPFDAFKYLMRGNKEGVLFLEARLRGNIAIYSTPDRPDYAERELTDVLYADIEEIEIPGE